MATGEGIFRVVMATSSDDSPGRPGMVAASFAVSIAHS